MDIGTRSRVTQLLARTSWLNRFGAGLVEAILQHSRVGSILAGSWIQGEGDETTGLWFVIDGAVQLYSQAPGEREVLIGHLGQGAAIGQTRRFGGGPRIVTAIAAIDSAVLIVSDSALERIAQEHPAIWEAVASLAYLQMGALARLVAETLALPPRQRIAARLVALSAQADGETGLHLAQQALAEMTGVTRKTVNVCLRSFEKAGLLTTGYGRITLRDRAGLEAIAAA